MLIQKRVLLFLISYWKSRRPMWHVQESRCRQVPCLPEIFSNYRAAVKGTRKRSRKALLRGLCNWRANNGLTRLQIKVLLMHTHTRTHSLVHRHTQSHTHALAHTKKHTHTFMYIHPLTNIFLSQTHTNCHSHVYLTHTILSHRHTGLQSTHYITISQTHLFNTGTYAHIH